LEDRTNIFEDHSNITGVRSGKVLEISPKHSKFDSDACGGLANKGSLLVSDGGTGDYLPGDATGSAFFDHRDPAVVKMLALQSATPDPKLFLH